MTRARERHLNGSLRIALIVMLLAAVILLVPSSNRLTPRPGARFDEVTRRIAVATEPAAQAAPQPRFVPDDFPPWQARTREELPAWLRRADRCAAEPGARILVVYADARMEARVVPSQGETLVGLFADVAEGVDIEVWPCRGTPRRFSVAELAEAPDRYLFTPRAGGIALFDNTENAVLFEHVAAVRLITEPQAMATHQR